MTGPSASVARHEGGRSGTQINGMLLGGQYYSNLDSVYIPTNAVDMMSPAYDSVVVLGDIRLTFVLS